MINIISSSRYRIDRKKIKQSISINSDLILNIIFVGRKKMKDLTQRYKNKNEILPVLSFYYEKENIGEIIICYPQVILLAAERNKKVDEMIEFLIKHGINNMSK